jgi:hypothetical protein
MGFRFDDPDGLASNHIRLQSVALRFHLGAGCRRLGDLRWVPGRELMNLHYVGFKWAGPDPGCGSEIRAGRARGDALT